MNVISDREREQWREAAKREAGPVRAPREPILPMPEFLRQVEQFYRLFPPAKRAIMRGENWRL